MPRLRPTLLAACLVVLAPAAARADLVRLSNGRVMTVNDVRFVGDTVVLSMPGGGEIRAPKDLVAELLPDEVPYAQTVAIEALAVSPAARRADWSADVLRSMVDRIAKKVGVDAKLAQAVVRVESNYEPLAVSARGAMGLMQLMPDIARQYGVNDPFDPEKNLEAGIAHLGDLLRRFDLPRALAAYNAGESAVARYGGIPPYRETQTYVERILARLQ